MDDQAEVIDALSRPEAWPSRAAPERIETHISEVFLVGGRAYKVKKALVLPFLDYGTLERRRAFCEEELRLNRRLAPDVYLRVAPIARAEDGRIALDGAGETVEWAVEMVRLPAREMLDAKLARGEVDNELLREIARTISAFHAAAATGRGVDEHGRPEAVAGNARENLAELARRVDGGSRAPGWREPGEGGLRALPAAVHAHLERWTERFLGDHAALLARRVAEGRIRDGHGDLHAGNVCVLGSRIVAYDCIEFSARFRCADVACDLAFLAMDLDRHGFRGASLVLVREYAELAHDPELPALVPFYKAYRALIRAKVAALRAGDLRHAQCRREADRAEARRFAQLAASYALPGGLILTCGLPASGKSTVAEAIAAPLGAVLLHSDVRRKVLAQVPLHEHRREGYGSGLYAPELKQRTYDSLLASAREALLHGRNAVVDATFPDAARRAPFRELARELGRPFALVHATADEGEIRRRFEARERDPEQASDADWGVYLRARDAFEAPTELGRDELVAHASGAQPLEDATDGVLERFVAQAGPGG